MNANILTIDEENDINTKKKFKNVFNIEDHEKLQKNKSLKKDLNNNESFLINPESMKEIVIPEISITKKQEKETYNKKVLRIMKKFINKLKNKKENQLNEKINLNINDKSSMIFIQSANKNYVHF